MYKEKTAKKVTKKETKKTTKKATKKKVGKSADVRTYELALPYILKGKKPKIEVIHAKLEKGGYDTQEQYTKVRSKRCADIVNVLIEMGELKLKKKK